MVQKMKKIGIMTMFYKSANYGGVLQAYALTYYLDKVGLRSEQICFDRAPVSIYYSFRRIVRQFIRAVICWIHLRKIPYEKTKKSIFEWAMQYVPHSKKTYNSKTIINTNDTYDCFIAGSDQIWTNASSSEYLLSFVESNRIKISYAASIGTKNISECAKKRFIQCLVDYRMISIREYESAKAIKDITGYNVEWCADPTLLLTKDEWDNICSDRLVLEKYVFCYFLGEDKRLRKIAREFASRKGLKIATIPYLLMKYNKEDANYADCMYSDASPSDFISLIKNAEYVMTDSFHVCVFSNIFSKEYFVFDRVSFPEMKIRLYSYLKLFEAANHFIEESSFSIDYIESLPMIDYTNNRESLERLLKDSRDYLNKLVLLQ